MNRADMMRIIRTVSDSGEPRWTLYEDWVEPLFGGGGTIKRCECVTEQEAEAAKAHLLGEE